MLTPDYLKNVSDDAERLYARLENNIIKDIVRRLKNTDFEMTESAKFQIQVAQESGKLYDEIIGEVSKNAGVSNKIVKKIFENSAVEALKFDDKIYKAHGLNPIPIKQSESMLQFLKSTLNKTNGSLYNLTLTTASTSQEKFIEVCNDAYMGISSGAFDYNTALNKAIKQLGDVQVEYDSGYRINVKSAAKRAVMTGVNQTCLKMQEMRADEMDCDLVEVTAHGGARPDHAEWQGKIYSRSGKSKKYPDLVKSTGYGTGAGLGGWNCRHNMFPYFEGTVRTYTDKELEELKPKSEESLQNSNENGIINSESKITKQLDSLNVKYNPVQPLNKSLTDDEIIEKISGGDETKGSCASVALAYAGNKIGLDVLDFRGGESQNYFSTSTTMYNISKLTGIKSFVEESKNDIMASMKLLREVQEGKEYILSTGAHAAVVRRNNSKLQYLELQDKDNNGFKQFTNKTLEKRFGCKQSHSSYGHSLILKNILIDIESFKGNPEFKQIIGYINTQKNSQMKGINGYAK